METRTSRRVSARLKTRTSNDLTESNLNNSNVDSRRSSRDMTGEQSPRHSSSNVSTTLSFTPSRVPLPGLTQTPAGETVGTATPMQTRGLDLLRQRIEEELGKPSRSVSDNTSPGLARLRNTPGRGLKERQRELIEKHEQIRQHSDKLSIGGGVALWPNMHQMRLSAREIMLLVVICICLMAVTGWLFVFLHGETVRNMWKITGMLESFSESHKVLPTDNYLQVKSAVLAWHSDFRQLLEGADKMLNVRRPPVGYQLYILAYLSGFGVLVYFLIDNMFSKSKLSPGRVRKWVCLLVVIGQWTVMLFVMFIYAQRVETAFVSNVQWLSERLGDVIGRDLDLHLFSVLTQYWRGRILPPAAPGVVWVLGLVPVQDVTVYLQYYSLPVATVLLTPVVRLCLALRSLYSSPAKE